MQKMIILSFRTRFRISLVEHVIKKEILKQVQDDRFRKD
jgi:hypothetical protein